MPQARGPAAPSFDPNLEYSPDPGFDNPGTGTLAGSGGSITGSQLVLSSTAGFSLIYTPVVPLVLGGTYLVSVDTATVVNNGALPVRLGGVNSANVATNVIGAHTAIVTISALTAQEIRISATNGKSGAYNSVSVHRLS